MRRAMRACALVGAIRAELGESDHVGRYGGEEFLIVLHGASARVEPRVADLVVARVAALRVPVGEHPVHFTVSIRVAARDASVAGFDALVEYADAAQYRAKAERRNRVVWWRKAPAQRARRRAVRVAPTWHTLRP